ncbi:MAG: hypothetical protein IJ518_06290 [Clostridia bacterium]|nr:hypothetical protein [Clostridia bacterium]
MNILICELSLLTANVALYKWLLGGGIGLMAILGLVVFAILALRVLQAEGPAAPAAEEEEASAPAVLQSTAEETDTIGEANEQEGDQA